MKLFGDMNEKTRNLFIYGVPLTDKELSKAAPAMVISLIVILSLLFLVGLSLV